MYQTRYSISVISKKFKVSISVVKQIERQYREHVIESFKSKAKNIQQKIVNNSNKLDDKDKRIKELIERNSQLEMENDLLKKFEPWFNKGTCNKTRKIIVIYELRHKYPLNKMLNFFKID